MSQEPDYRYTRWDVLYGPKIVSPVLAARLRGVPDPLWKRVYWAASHAMILAFQVTIGLGVLALAVAIAVVFTALAPSAFFIAFAVSLSIGMLGRAGKRR